MKVIKRDGRIVEFDKKKIVLAIEKANSTVNNKEKVKKKEIDSIIEYIEKLDKKRILVEDIQDIIEIKLMEYKHYELAKRYIVYRYNRALVRRQNTTDETILGLIRQNNHEYLEEKTFNNTIIASTQRNLIAAEVSKDLSKRLLLPEKISKAHEEGILYFHDIDYFLQPIFGSCLINLKDMFEHGTVINNIKVESPKSFQTACNIMTQIMIAVSSSEYGDLSIELKNLGKYLKISKEKYQKQLKEKYKDKIPKEMIDSIIQDQLQKELSSGIQTIEYQLNTLLSINGKLPQITFFMHLDELDPYIEENAMIYEEILNQKYEGVKSIQGDTQTLTGLKLLYVLDENNKLTGGKYDYITKLAIECAKKWQSPIFISAKKLREINHQEVHSPIGFDIFPKLYKKEDNYLFEGRFHQGFITINLPQIALLSDSNEEKFYNLLKERLEFCYEALMCRHYALLNTTSDISPIHYQYGAISRLKKHEKINELLKGGYSFLSLGYIGLKETVYYLTQEDITTKNGMNCAKKILNYLKKTLDKWEKQTNIGFQLYQTTSSKISKYFKKIDKQKFNIEDELEEYSTQYKISFIQDEEVLTKLKELQDIAPIKAVLSSDELEKVKLIPFLYENVLYTIIE